MGSNLTGTIGGKSIIGTLGSGQIVMGKNVIPDWNQNDPTAEDYIKNRPGGYTVTIPEINIQWDGVIGDRVVAVNRSPYSPKPNFVKVSDEIPAKEDLIGASILFVKDGEEITYSFNDSSNTIRMDEAYSGEGYSVQIEGAQGTVQFIVISKVPAKTHIGMVEYSETGVYFYQFNNVYVRSLVRESYKKNITIPQKYIEGLPDISELTKNVMVNGDESIALKSPNKEFKMTVDDTGTPSFTDTGDATNKFTPVTPSELAEKQDVLTDADKRSIVKTGMTSGAAWTDAEQKAARDRMGIPGNAELLHSITVSESGVKQVNIPAFPNLSRIIVGVVIPIVSAQFPLFMLVHVDGDKLYVAGSYYGLTEAESSIRYEIEIDAGIVYAESSGTGRGWGGANIIGANNAGEFITGEAITGAYFYTTADSHIPEGTTFNVYGVKK